MKHRALPRIATILAYSLAVMSVMTVSVPRSAAFAAPHEPARGSAERKAVLDALRPAVEGRLGAPVEFVVKSIEVDRGFAFLTVEPQRPGGGAIDVKAMGLDTEFMDGLTTYALIKRQSGGWTLVDWALGPTDVAWWGWWDTYGAPRSIFPP